MAVTMTITEFKKFLEQKLKEADAIEAKIDAKIVERYTNDLNKIIKKAINEFYGSYTPKYYKRKYSLKYMYNIKSGKNQITIDCDPKYTFAKHRLGNEEIYDLVFRSGYHGGAWGIAEEKIPMWGEHPDPGTPYYRTPAIGWVDEETGEEHRRFEFWAYRAKSSKSPLERIQEGVAEYEKTMEDILDEVIDEELEKWWG